MMEWSFVAVSALWLGILTSVSPCPLATNIAAISYIGRKVHRPRHVFLTGLLYTLGRTAAYLGVAIVLVASMLSVPQVSVFLQKYLHMVLGPLLIVVGMFLLGLIQFNLGGSGLSVALQKRVDALGIWAAMPLGMIFALSFCPTSAALFFGSLIPLSLQADSRLTLPLIYGVGTAVPVLVFATLIAGGAQSLGKAFQVLSRVEWWARMATGGIFVTIGLWFSLKYVFEVV